MNLPLPGACEQDLAEGQTLGRAWVGRHQTGGGFLKAKPPPRLSHTFLLHHGNQATPNGAVDPAFTPSLSGLKLIRCG